MLMESEKTMKAVGLRFLILSLCALLSVIGFEDIASAQTNQGKSASSGAPSNPRITIKGRITDDHDEPLPGANVLVKGTSIGTSADVDGNYSLTFQRSPGKQDVLIYSFIGTESKEFNVSTSTRLNVQLKTSSLDAVVVQGIYTQTEGNLHRRGHYDKRRPADRRVLDEPDAESCLPYPGHGAGGEQQRGIQPERCAVHPYPWIQHLDFQ